MDSEKPNANNHFQRFKENFPYQGEALYQMVFDHYRNCINISKPGFVLKNLEKIFSATFKITPKIGFHEMSLRDLSKETGLSMGGLYAYIESKETIALMIKDVVKTVCEDIVLSAKEEPNPETAIAILIKHLAYATEQLQPWFYFLYFETRSLPADHQEDSKGIESSLIDLLTTLMAKIAPPKDTAQKDCQFFIATVAMATVQDRYLKPWKHMKSDVLVETYADQVVTLILRNLKDY